MKAITEVSCARTKDSWAGVVAPRDRAHLKEQGMTFAPPSVRLASVGRLMSLLHNMGEPFVTVSDDNTIAHANAAATGLLGGSGNLIGQNLLAIVPGLEATPFAETCHKVARENREMVFDAHLEGALAGDFIVWVFPSMGSVGVLFSRKSRAASLPR